MTVGRAYAGRVELSHDVALPLYGQECRRRDFR